MIAADTHNAPNWVDLSTPDIDTCVAFYRELLGWQVNSDMTPMGEYFIGRLGDRQVAGMMKSGREQTGMPAVWTTYFYVDDVDAKTERSRAIGGTVLSRPFDIPDGRVAIVADPTGAMFGLISGMEPSGVWLERVPGAVSWVEVLTREPIEAERFYTELFDWKAEGRLFGETRYTTFRPDDEPVAGLMMMPRNVPTDAPAHWAVYFAVADCELTVEEVQRLGGRVLGPTMPIEMGKFAVLADPSGAVFQVMEYEE